MFLTGCIACAFGPEAIDLLKQIGIAAMLDVLAIAGIVLGVYDVWSQRRPEAAAEA